LISFWDSTLPSSKFLQMYFWRPIFQFAWLLPI
jgi:hypothetical protein